ncbi:uronyl 2-sulfotransferase-like [Diadema antillarum]|uniref:uronyl 2-sulfotransferase-like n=1 Tax=Diadema antillarum TaxID=105358 RepID=UPI003A8A844E
MSLYCIFVLEICQETKANANLSESVRFLSSFSGTLSCPVDPEFAATINNTVYGHPILELKGSQVLYVSVPKCGSRTFVWISWALKEANNISDIITLPYLLKKHSPAEMKLLMDKNFEASPPRSLFHGHIRFFPPSSSAVHPVFISIIRDPLSRHVSWYYFMRFGDADMKASELNKGLSQSADVAGINETYDECVLNNKADCAWPYYLHMNVITFCGYEKKCDSPETALEQAKRNVDNFLFVGIMEEYEDSLRVLERLIPTMYRGTSEQYFKNKGEFASNSKTAFKKEPSSKAAEIMRERLKYDYEFYYYVRERFHKLKKHLGIGPC